MRYALLVPCYNAAAYINTFLTNIALLSKPFDEVIFYDDASTDNTVQLLTDKGERVIKGEKNSGPGYARNMLAHEATSTYIHFHDIDDKFNPDFLQIIDEQIILEATDVVLGNANWIDQLSGKTIIAWRYNKAELLNDPLAYFIANPLGIINTIYKKTAFLKANGFNEKIKCWEDADLHIRMAAIDSSFSFVDHVLAYSVRHDNGISKNQEWCWGCRLQFLKSYATDLHQKYNAIISLEFEKAAYGLFHYHDIKKAITAFKYSRRYSRQTPLVNNPVLQTVKKISPLTAFLLKALIIKINSR